MAQEQRSTFTSFLSKNNGNIDKLMDRLKKQLTYNYLENFLYFIREGISPSSPNRLFLSYRII